MRLMFPSPGEAYDRLTILQLKLLAAAKKKLTKQAAAFTEEQQALSEYMQTHKYQVPSPLAACMFMVNSQLWDLEDRQRELLTAVNFSFSLEADQPGLGEYIRNAQLVTQLNDKRAQLVQEINQACGVYAPEKLHYVNA